MTTKLLPPEANVPSRPATGAGRSKLRSVCLSAVALAVVTIPTGLWNSYDGNRHLPLTGFWRPHSEQDTAKLVRKYNLQTGVRWMNPDGGRWRVMYTCNGQSPCPTLYADEGDMVELTVKSDVYSQSTIHWSGIGYHGTGDWNDGTAGISQYPILPRGNFTHLIDTTGSWGLNWYAEHTTAASADGLYGMVYVAPSPSRPRPYHLITDDKVELRKIMEAEKHARHLAIKNHQHRDTGWKLLRMKAEGSEFYCYDSIVVNGKGRVHCRQPEFGVLNGQALDEKGCIQPEGLPQETCTPSTGDYEVIETEGRAYMMLNLINIGFEHGIVASIDQHKMIIVANNGGFVHPQEADVVEVPSASRLTVLVKLNSFDPADGDYAIRISSTSRLQNLQGYAVLRYPGGANSRRPVYGQPMKLPQPASPDAMCVLADGTARPACGTAGGHALAPFPASPPPSSPRGPSLRRAPAVAAADVTVRLSAGQRPSLTEEHVPEYFLNEQPWQLFRSAMTPLLFQDQNEDAALPGGASRLGKPVVAGIPLGSVVDLIIENQLNDSIPLYKHGVPAWLLGLGSGGGFPYASVEEAAAAAAAGGSGDVVLNLENPALVTVHELPPLGWSVLRFKVTAKAATMIHAVKLRYFALGMSAPILEGILPNDPAQFPESVAKRPHVEFEPKNDGVFG
ncbi:hypothetical protein MCOR27_002778 [Pyricularia oryzae]|nr:hypothetical protein MCOR19_003603 [Pyricularia oryzae]KAI6284423.1 hypothetical protein MCOR27_002778 [Pyricularia oryzae]KAI6336169.1 hypothetical protein MCOR29_000329 [Pyricularia oryzae]KAI6442559.1 hypothetical protein MCOR22_005830 [Pyricularia oryzae]KAI6463723.1 hypothetical protein MCOR18_010655 [Pyricularia oryzae]